VVRLIEWILNSRSAVIGSDTSTTPDVAICNKRVIKPQRLIGIRMGWKERLESAFGAGTASRRRQDS
jgi:hypothetical protein